jgi:hypothetical protein
LTSATLGQFFKQQEQTFALWHAANKLSYLQHVPASYVVYANELKACIIFLYIKIFASLKKQACLLAIISYFFGGGGD